MFTERHFNNFTACQVVVSEAVLQALISIGSVKTQMQLQIQQQMQNVSASACANARTNVNVIACAYANTIAIANMVTAHFLEAMGLLRISGSNGNSAEEAEAHAGLAHCMVAGRAADAKPCWHITHGPPCCHAVLCCSHAAIYQAQSCTCSLTHSSLSRQCYQPNCGGPGSGGGDGNKGWRGRGVMQPRSYAEVRAVLAA